MVNYIEMFFVYILKSENNHKYYTGQTDDIDRRLREHNSGKGNYSSRYAPWKLVYSEQYGTRELALRRERYLKSAAGRKWIKKNVNVYS